MALASGDIMCAKQEGQGTDDSTVLSWATALKALGVAMAGYQFAEAINLAEKEYEIAKKYWRIAQNWLDYYDNTFAPLEDVELKEAMNQPAVTPIYETARGRARLNAWLEMRRSFPAAARCISRYNTGLKSEMLAEFASTQGAALAMADGLGYRNERAYLEARDDVRFERMLNTAKRGRDMVADNVSFAQAAAGIYGNAFGQAWEGLKGAGMLFGYKMNRNDTNYPTTFLDDRGKLIREATAANRAALDTQERQLVGEN